VSVLAGIVLVAELVVRSALVYVVVALAPLVFAAQLWPALQGAGRKLLQLLFALVVSKLVIAVALAVAAAAAVGAGSGGEVTALPAPEVAADDPGGSVTQAVGILLAATAAFGISAFSPLLVVKLLPLTEAALAAQGIRGGPLRAGQQAVTLGYYTRYLRGGAQSSRLASGRVDHGGGGPGASGGSGASGAPGAGGPTGSGGSGAGGRAVGGAGVAVGLAAANAVRRSATKGASAMTDTAEAVVPARAKPPSSPSTRATDEPPAGKSGGRHGAGS